MGWFWFLGTLAPVIGIVQSGGQAFADRYAYISSVGIFIMVAWGAAELLHNWKYRKYALSVTASVILFVLLIQTRTQVRFWQNSISLFEHTLSVTRNNWLIHYNLGRAYQLANNPDKAIENYLEALRLQPEDPDTHNNLGMLLRKQNKLDEAIAHFRKAIEINPALAAAYSNLGRTLQLQGKFDEAIECLKRSVSLEPDQPERYNSLAAIYIQAGRTKEAVESALHVCQMTNFSDPYFLKTLASAYAAEDNFTEAVKTAEKAQKLAEIFNDKKLAEDLQKRLQLYKQGRQ
jgi:tetratricopeptide (TPR) repeat protein